MRCGRRVPTGGNAPTSSTAYNTPAIIMADVPLGSDIHGNITRLDNKIQELPDKMLRWQDELENLKVQLENAKEEAQKEFPQEEELAEKVARIGELNVLLDMDKKDQVLLDDGEGVEIEPEQKKKERER